MIYNNNNKKIRYLPKSADARRVEITDFLVFLSVETVLFWNLSLSARVIVVSVPPRAEVGRRRRRLIPLLVLVRVQV